MRKRLLGILFIFFTSLPLFTQVVSGVNFSQVNKAVRVTYYLSDDASKVDLLISYDGGKTWSSPLNDDCTSDVGKDVSKGFCTILWDPPYDVVGDNICFKVRVRTEVKKTRITQVFYDGYGKFGCDWIQIGYCGGFGLGQASSGSSSVQCSAANFRMALLDVELAGFGLDFKNDFFYWQPVVRLDIPCKDKNVFYMCYIDVGLQYALDRVFGESEEFYEGVHSMIKKHDWLSKAEFGLRIFYGEMFNVDFFVRYRTRWPFQYSFEWQDVTFGIALGILSSVPL